MSIEITGPADGSTTTELVDPPETLGLALSGGGIRATLFHLGVFKFLQEAGLLEKVKHITAVSGGSIAAAHLVKNWKSYLDKNKVDDVSRELVKFAQFDIRGRIIRRLISHSFLRARYASVRVQLFERYLSKILFGDMYLSDVPKHTDCVPTLDILATNITTIGLAYFTYGRFVPDAAKESELITETTLAKAVAISAAFPGLFPPVALTAGDLKVDLSDFRFEQFFIDGGAYDNLGIRRFMSVLQENPTIADNILVVDATGAYDWTIGHSYGSLGTALRLNDIFLKRINELEYECAHASCRAKCTFLRISDIVGDPPALDQAIQQKLKNIRTDLDQFSPVEIRSIVQHGYSVAAHRLKHLAPNVASGEPWDPMGEQETKIEGEKDGDALYEGRKRKWRLFSRSDLISWAHAAVLVVLLAILVPEAWEFYDRYQLVQTLENLPVDSAGAVDFRGTYESVPDILDIFEGALLRNEDRFDVQLEIAASCHSIWLYLFTSVHYDDITCKDWRRRAYELFEKALRNLKRMELKAGWKTAQLSQANGIRFHLLKQYESALTEFENARRTIHTITYTNSCRAALERARYDGSNDVALAYCEEATAFAESLNMWRPYYDMALLHYMQDNMEQSIDYWIWAQTVASHVQEDISDVLKNDLTGINKERACEDHRFMTQFRSFCTE